MDTTALDLDMAVQSRHIPAQTSLNVSTSRTISRKLISTGETGEGSIFFLYLFFVLVLFKGSLFFFLVFFYLQKTLSSSKQSELVKKSL